jgi:hypothetical protein
MNALRNEAYHFADFVSITEGDKTHEVSLFIRPLTPKARMI